MRPFLANTGLEAILLTGGKSSRMGEDKASIEVAATPLAVRIAAELKRVCDPVTIIGHEPLDGCRFIRDRELFQGPLAAIAQFAASKPFVFLASCDLPLFESGVVTELAEKIESFEACIPHAEGKPQPLCALYQERALLTAKILAKGGEKRVMAWIGALKVLEVKSEELSKPFAVQSANTREELNRLLSGRSMYDAS